jgi:hypothetical protein
MILFSQRKRTPTLGILVKELQNTVFNKEPRLIHPIRQKMMIFFSEQTPSLMNLPTDSKGNRIGRLRKIAVIRNLCNHPRNFIEPERIQEMLDHVLKHKEHAFFRYFPKI